MKLKGLKLSVILFVCFDNKFDEENNSYESFPISFSNGYEIFICLFGNWMRKGIFHFQSFFRLH